VFDNGVLRNTLGFDVHGSVHIGNVYVRLKVQLDAYYMYYLFLYIFALHVSCGICTHPQEHKLQSTAIGMCNVYGMLTLSDPMSDLVRHYGFPVPDAFLGL
jgi:hypothetical protein